MSLDSTDRPAWDANRVKANVIALYLPQYHPIPENDRWWSPGFTEWTNAARARPLFRGHYQPHVPADLGYYDLRLEETRIAQAEMARRYGVGAFCYYHYWFGDGRRLLQRPFEEVLQSGKPDFPFCLAWANQSWEGVWHGVKSGRLIEQTYPGCDDHRRHFETLLPAFSDPRYVRVDGRPLFVIYDPHGLPDSNATLDLWRELAVRAGLKGLFFVAEHSDSAWPYAELGYDAMVHVAHLTKRRSWVPWSQPIAKIHVKLCELMNYPTVRNYAAMEEAFVPDIGTGGDCYPCVVPNWDNTPRSGHQGLVLQDSSPELFRRQLRRAIRRIENNPVDHRVLFVKSWNEWAEGNHLEPDLRYGHAYLQALRDELLVT